MDKKVLYKIIGVVMIVYSIVQFATGVMGMSLIPNINIITLILSAPIVLVGVLLVGVYLVVEEKDK